MIARRVEPPLEHVAFDDHRAGKLTLLGTLGDRSDVNDQTAGGGEGFEVSGSDAGDSLASLVNQLVGGGAHEGS
jgi:hypothetical protein